MEPSERSSVLFCYFAQWFTDSFLRKHPLDPRRTTSNHEIDLCQIYGLDEPSTWALREGSDGRLKTRIMDGEEYPPLLYKDGNLDTQFFDDKAEVGLSFLRAGRAPLWEKAVNEQSDNALNKPDRRDYFYASGLDRAGSTVAYSAFNIIFLREHNRIANLISDGEPSWDDDRIFETARLVNIRQILGVVVNDYIRHIAGVFPFELETGFAESQPWYRTNRISIEFNLLYRWHSLIPEQLELENGCNINFKDYRFNNKLLEEVGIERLISAASAQKAGRYGLFNTPSFMKEAELGGLKWARMFGVQPFNRYRERFGLDAYYSFDALTGGNRDVTNALKAVYSDVNDVEFTIGLLAEGRGEGELMPETVTRMVAYDAFTHILTNPLLASEIHTPATFSKVGWDIIQESATLEQIVKRNVQHPNAVYVSLAV
jgi:prostaglandin-endoperoxide synthase 2